MKQIYRRLKKVLSFLPFYDKVEKHKIYVKYTISGGTATVIDLDLLYILTDFFNVYYLLSSAIAFTVAFFISFYLQKFWTFRDNGKEVYKQMFLYFGVGIINLIVNIVGMHILVEKFNVMYIFSQIIMGAFVAIFSFLMYRFIIFPIKIAKSKKINSNKKILIATGIFPPDIGGPATYVKTLCEELPKRGYEVKVVTYGDKNSKLNPPAGGQNSKFFLFIIDRSYNIFLRYLKYFWRVFRLCGWADVVYAQGAVSEGLPSWLACKLRRKPYILKIVGDYAWEQGRQRFGVKDLLDEFQDKKYNKKVERMRKIQKLVARGAEIIITPSEYLKNIIQKWEIDKNPPAGGKIKVIYNCVDDIDLKINKEEAKKELGLSGDIIISAGRLVPWKGFDLLIDLMSELLKVNPDFKLVIIGEGPETKNYELRIKNYGLGRSVKLIGSIEQKKLHQYMRASDIFVLNTGYEGLPHVIIEAMQVGLPIITTKVGGNPEVVENDKTGLLVGYNNRIEIKNAILKLYKDEELKNRLINNAKNNLGKFSKERMIEEVIKIL